MTRHPDYIDQPVQPVDTLLKRFHCTRPEKANWRQTLKQTPEHGPLYQCHGCGFRCGSNLPSEFVIQLTLMEV